MLLSAPSLAAPPLPRHGAALGASRLILVSALLALALAVIRFALVLLVLVAGRLSERRMLCAQPPTRGAPRGGPPAVARQLKIVRTQRHLLAAGERDDKAPTRVVVREAASKGAVELGALGEAVHAHARTDGEPAGAGACAAACGRRGARVGHFLGVCCAASCLCGRGAAPARVASRSCGRLSREEARGSEGMIT